MTQSIEYNGITIKMPFKIFKEYLKTDEMEQANHFSGEKVKLPMFAGAVRNKILDAEMDEDYKTMRKGLDSFQRFFAKEYMVLLD